MSFQKLKEINGHAGAVYCCVADKNHLYTGSADKYVARWLIDQGTQDKFAIKFEQSVYSLELAWNGILAVGLSDGSLHFFDITDRKELKFFDQHKVGVFSIHFEPEKKYLYVGDADGNLSVWDEKFKLMIYLPLNCGKIRTIISDTKGERVVIGGQDGYIRIFETQFFNETKTFLAHEDGCTALVLDKDEQRIISGGKDAYMKSWDIATGSNLTSIPAHNFAIYDLLILEDGKMLVSGSRDKKIKLWNSSDLTYIDRIEPKTGGHTHSVNDLYKLNETTFISVSDDKRNIVWKLAR